MEADGIASLWVGSSTSRQAFDDALHAAFSADGDFLGSPFSRGFGIDCYDDALREAECFTSEPRRMTALLPGSSYAEVTIPRFERISAALESGDNCVVLLCNFRYSNTVRQWNGPGVTLWYVGAVSYV